jgi:mRNA-degrading endonuclease YafQ of YafQ-DinJ toxin-antitoxin module
MSYTLVFTGPYTNRAARFLKRHPDLRRPNLKTLQPLEANPFHPSLRLHALGGRLHGLQAVSINLACRITLELVISGEEVIPVDAGDQGRVY